MLKGMPVIRNRLVPEKGGCQVRNYRPQAAWTCRVPVLLFVLCLVLVPSTAIRPIKLHLHFDANIAELSSSDSVVFFKKSAGLIAQEVSLMLQVTGTLKPLTVKIEPNEKNLCRSVKVPANLKGQAGAENVQADFALFLRVHSCVSKQSQAESAPCSFTDRPTSGLISFCTGTLAEQDAFVLTAVLLRHLISLLGFDQRLIVRRNSTCFLRRADTLKCWSGPLNAASAVPKLIVASRLVLRHSKTFLRNNSCLGLPLAPDGRAWDSSAMFSSLLADSPITASLAPWLSLDAMTLGLLDDLGWYSVKSTLYTDDPMHWGAGAGSVPVSCATSCSLGLCNRTDNAPCFQVGPRANACVVCQHLSRLRVVTMDYVCLVEKCSDDSLSYRGVCYAQKGIKTFNCPLRGTKSSRCFSYNQACVQPRASTIVAKLAKKIIATIASTTSTTTTPTFIQGYQFSLSFEHLDYDSVAVLYFNDIKTQIANQIGKLLGLTDREIVITDIVKGSTVVYFYVYGSTYSAKKVFLLLQQSVYKNGITLTLGGKTYHATEIESFNTVVHRSYMTEIIVGSTLGIVLIIGIASMVIIIVVKKVKRPTNTVYPSPEVPSDVDSAFGRSNSLQTVSVASYAAIYELRRDWGSNPRPTSLRNVVVGGPNLRGRVSTSEESGQL